MGGNSRHSRRDPDLILASFQADRPSQDKNSIEKLEILFVPKFKALMKFRVLLKSNISAF